jgi:AraC-like DNA-binding protein
VCFYAGQELCCYSSGQGDFARDIPLSLAEFTQPIAALVEQGKSDELMDRLQSRLADLLRLRAEPQLICDFVFDILNWIKIELARQHRTGTWAGLPAISRERLRACADGHSLAAYLNHLLHTIGEAASSLLAEDPNYYIVRQAREYARQHYSEVHFSLQDVAAHVGMSKNHFSQVFHKITGQKFWDYVTQLRIEKAKELLKQSNCSNYEICRAIGYESEFYFSKIFKREVGVAAQQYRKL